MTEQDLYEALRRIINNTARADDPIFLLKFLIHNLPEASYGSFEDVPVNPYEEKDGSFPPECRIQSIGPITMDQYENCRTLGRLADEMSAMLDTAWTEEKVKPSTGLDNVIYFREEVPF